MRVLKREFAESFARDWVEAWNARDLERVLAHYRDDFEFRSPFIASLYGEGSGGLVGKAQVADYWRKALAKIENLHFTVEDLLLGAGTLTIYYRGHRGMVAETFFFDAEGLVYLATACYASA